MAKLGILLEMLSKEKLTFSIKLCVITRRCCLACFECEFSIVLDIYLKKNTHKLQEFNTMPMGKK